MNWFVRLMVLSLVLALGSVMYSVWSFLDWPGGDIDWAFGGVCLFVNAFLALLTITICLRASPRPVLDIGDSSEGQHEFFCLVIILVIVAVHVGGYGRGDQSPLPWVAYAQTARGGQSPLPWATYAQTAIKFGALWPLNTFLVVVLTDSWLLFGVACFVELLARRGIAEARDDRDRDARILKLKYRRIFYYLLNVTIGLLLMSEDNLVYRFLESKRLVTVIFLAAGKRRGVNQSNRPAQSALGGPPPSQARLADTRSPARALKRVALMRFGVLFKRRIRVADCHYLLQVGRQKRRDGASGLILIDVAKLVRN